MHNYPALLVWKRGERAGAASLAFGVGDTRDYYFWQFHAGMGGDKYMVLTPTPFKFVTGQTYNVRLAVERNKVTTWIDDRVFAICLKRPRQSPG